MPPAMRPIQLAPDPQSRRRSRSQRRRQAESSPAPRQTRPLAQSPAPQASPTPRSPAATQMGKLSPATGAHVPARVGQPPARVQGEAHRPHGLSSRPIRNAQRAGSPHGSVSGASGRRHTRRHARRPATSKQACPGSQLPGRQELSSGGVTGSRHAIAPVAKRRQWVPPGQPSSAAGSQAGGTALRTPSPQPATLSTPKSTAASGAGRRRAVRAPRSLRRFSAWPRNAPKTAAFGDRQLACDRIWRFVPCVGSRRPSFPGGAGDLGEGFFDAGHARSRGVTDRQVLAAWRRSCRCWVHGKRTADLPRSARQQPG